MPRQLFLKLTNKSFSLKTNIFANFFGNAVMTVASIVFVPIYLRYIGIEAYGLVGFFTFFQAILVIMDLGLSITLTREIALRDGVAEKAQESRNLLRTLELCHWGIALSLGILSLLLVPLLENWINPNKLSDETIRACFLLMSLVIFLQFPINFYQCGLLGLQKQVLSSVINIFFTFFRYFGTLAALHFVVPNPQTFFGWQAISSASHVFILAGCLWLTMPKGSESARFQLSLFKNFWKFTTGMGGIGVISIILMQIDKIILVKILSLENFGYYSVASVAANALYRLIYPIFQAFFPKLLQLVGKTETDLLVQTYHQGCQIMSVIILPLAMMFIFFSKEIMFLWQKNEEVVARTSLLVTLLTIGYALNSLIIIPYALQLAFGWTKLYFYTLLFILILSIPSIVLLSLQYGAIGATIIVICIYAILIFILIPIMHRKILPDQKWKWVWEDVSLPLIGTTLVALIARFLFRAETSQNIIFIQLGVVFLIIFLVACFITPFTRNLLLRNSFKEILGI